jgi:splicing factor 45
VNAQETASSLTLICLRNMIAAADVDSDFEGEVREECEQFGAVVSVKVYVDPLPPNEDEAVRVFVKFAEAEAASKAKKSLDQRWFGGRVVRCDFYDEFKFARGEY